MGRARGTGSGAEATPRQERHSWDPIRKRTTFTPPAPGPTTGTCPLCLPESHLGAVPCPSPRWAAIDFRLSAFDGWQGVGVIGALAVKTTAAMLPRGEVL